MKGTEFFAQVAGKQPFSKMHPQVAGFFREYLSNEKIILFNDSFVLNTHFPPYPSIAFDNMIEHFSKIGDIDERRLYSVTLAVTNRCNYHCWHCYNADRVQDDIPLATMKMLGIKLQDLGLVMLTLSGGEPLIRDDLEEIVGSFDARTCLVLNTTGEGLTNDRASKLRDNGLFALGVSLDSSRQDEHDRLRGKKGAFRIALNALDMASKNGLYPYVIAVSTRDFLKPEHFRSFMKFALESGAKEVHLLEPCATGKLAGKSEVLLGQAEKQQILDYQREISQDEDMPILSTFTYLESSRVFGCGAGLTHLYIDGSGEVSPCNLVPLSFGNITKGPFTDILDNMSRYFKKPRSSCIGQILGKHIISSQLPAIPEVSAEICEKYLPESHDIPRFFEARESAKGEVGKEELRSAYNNIHEYYDEFWLKEAAKPILELLDKLSFNGNERVFEAGCGTGYGTVLISEKLKDPANILAVDLSEGMLVEARKRAQTLGIEGIQFHRGDALEILNSKRPFDIIFTSWVLGYISLKSFFDTASRALEKEGLLAFIVHKENSPREPLQIFEEFILEDPSILLKRVVFDFPRDMEQVKKELIEAELKVEELREGNIVFKYDTPEEVLDHLLKSGAGTAFYDAIKPEQRDYLREQFLKRLAVPKKPKTKYEVIHDYISCIARKG